MAPSRRFEYFYERFWLVIGDTFYVFAAQTRQRKHDSRNRHSRTSDFFKITDRVDDENRAFGVCFRADVVGDPWVRRSRLVGVDGCQLEDGASRGVVLSHGDSVFVGGEHWTTVVLVRDLDHHLTLWSQRWATRVLCHRNIHLHRVQRLIICLY